MVRFHDQLFSGGGDRVVLQTDRVPSFVVPACQPSSSAVSDRTVRTYMTCVCFSVKLFILFNFYKANFFPVTAVVS